MCDLINEDNLNMEAAKTGLDFLLRDKATAQFLNESMKILDKRLTNEIIMQIKKNKIFLNICEYPSSTTSNFVLQKPDEAALRSIHIITIDRTIKRCLKFNDSEIAALILHEVGHILNYPPLPIPPERHKTIDEVRKAASIAAETSKRENQNKEFYADYFAKKCGFKDELISSFETYLKSNLPSIDEERELFELRKQKLNSDETFDDGQIKKLKVLKPKE